ncbi:MAG: DUF4952 domain-containing protein [Thermosynechococcaceae cyanobacterium]
MRFLGGLTLLLLAATLPACTLDLDTSPICKDFFRLWGETPKALQFKDCQKVEGSQSDQLVATYVVSGRDAAQVERFLVQGFKMAPLRFLCCGWENFYARDQKPARSKEGFYKDKRGRQFYISMGSGEAFLNGQWFNERRDWPRIPQFTVRVTTSLGEV